MGHLKNGDFGRGRWSIDAHYITSDGMWRVPLVTFKASNLWTSSVERDPLIGRWSAKRGLQHDLPKSLPNRGGIVLQIGVSDAVIKGGHRHG